jgi:hypothetical protein
MNANDITSTELTEIAILAQTLRTGGDREGF